MTTASNAWRDAVRRWAWLCPLLMTVLAAGLLKAWGLSWWTAILTALLLACPVLLLWGAIQIRRKRRKSDGQ